ncbi:MAG: TraR/DksA family transcriptional regulator [Betaproteobacteria bacterium]|nr:TraR/DksA family transcriptional regulator [Betaproteobacteria bacterium]
MTQSQQSILDGKLEDRYASLLEEVRDELEKSENQQYIELIGHTPTDIGDESVADALADLNLEIIDRHIQEIRDIEAAKVRVRDRSYGICIACATDIDYERLLAYPTAKRCFVCQRQREKTFAHAGIPKL